MSSNTLQNSHGFRYVLGTPKDAQRDEVGEALHPKQHINVVAMTKVVRSSDHARFGNSTLQRPLGRRWFLLDPIGRKRAFAVVTCRRSIGETILLLLEQMPRHRFIAYATCLVGWHRGCGGGSGGGGGPGAGHY